MENHLNLIKSDVKELEKRIFPRFPFTYLTFKGQNGENKVYEVKDISFTGMQLCLKNGGHSYSAGNDIEGTLHWKGASLDTVGIVQWVSGQRVGVSFKTENNFNEEVKNFLSIDNIIAGMRPLHQSEMGVELPSKLKYWLQADGPVEVFVWRHNDGEVSGFHVILMDSFVEWEDGKGIKTGRVLTKRDLETPLVQEDEFVFQMDEQADSSKLDFAKSVVDNVPTGFLPSEAHDFLRMKLA